jgi:hypothetical protein
LRIAVRTGCHRLIAESKPTGPAFTKPSFPPALVSERFEKLKLSDKIVMSDVMFLLHTSIPGNTTGCLFESANYGTGVFVGVVVDDQNSGLFFRAVLYVDAAADRLPVADLQIRLPDPRIPTDGETHAVAWAISLSGKYMKLYFDGHERFSAHWSKKVTQWSVGAGAPPVAEATFGLYNKYIPMLQSSAWTGVFTPPFSLWVMADTPAPTLSPAGPHVRAECTLEPNCPMQYSFNARGAVQESCEQNPTGNFWR